MYRYNKTKYVIIIITVELTALKSRMEQAEVANSALAAEVNFTMSSLLLTRNFH
jgi:hypothetical protein